MGPGSGGRDRRLFVFAILSLLNTSPWAGRRENNWRGNRKGSTCFNDWFVFWSDRENGIETDRLPAPALFRVIENWWSFEPGLRDGWASTEERIKNMLQVVLVICACLDACLGAKKTRSILFAGSCCCCCCCRIMMMTWISKQIGLSVKSNSIGHLEAELKASERKIYCVYSAFASFVESGY